MSVDKDKKVSDLPADDTSGDTQDPKGNDTSGDKVSYDTYKKTLSEAKRLKSELKAKEDALELARQDKLAAEGNKDELISQLKVQNAKLEKQHKDTFSSFVYSSLDNQVKEAALAMGCIDPDAVTKLADLSDIEVDSKTFKADKDAVAGVLENIKKAKPYLFNKPGPKINSKLPSGAAASSGEKPLKDLSTDELYKKLKEVNQKLKG